jgi:hypothetical protein
MVITGRLARSIGSPSVKIVGTDRGGSSRVRPVIVCSSMTCWLRSTQDGLSLEQPARRRGTRRSGKHHIAGRLDARGDWAGGTLIRVIFLFELVDLNGAHLEQSRQVSALRPQCASSAHRQAGQGEELRQTRLA